VGAPALNHSASTRPDAMYAAELKLLRDWRDIVHAWEYLQ
jgi:hypothetical protein